MWPLLCEELGKKWGPHDEFWSMTGGRSKGCLPRSASYGMLIPVTECPYHPLCGMGWFSEVSKDKGWHIG